MADSKRICSVDGCDNKIEARGMCAKHYQRAIKSGEIVVKKRATPNRNPPKTCTFQGCDTGHYAKGFCFKHYLRLFRHGSADGGKGHAAKGDHAKWIQEHKNYKGEDCLPWPFKARDRNGYGVTTSSLTGKQGTASREMCYVAHGEPPHSNMDAAHSCGKGHEGCMNPRHIRWATRAENHADKELHGTKLIGERTASAKLTASQVAEIYTDIRTPSVIAREYEITAGQVWNIRTGRHWSHITSRLG